MIQIDSTHSVASLLQRVGRSGRGENSSSLVGFFNSNNWKLLQSIACWNLGSKNIIEPIKPIHIPYDILAHQILSITKENSGILINDLLIKIKENTLFNNIAREKVIQIIKHFLEKDYLEQLQNELIIGIEGEYIVNSREFYSVFETEVNFSVKSNGNKIGNIPFSPSVKVGSNILLSAKIWKIIDVDFDSLTIQVVVANDGKKPIFNGGSGIIHEIVRKEMLNILYDKSTLPDLDKGSLIEITKLKKEFSNFEINDFDNDKPLITIDENKFKVGTFTSSKINNTISYLAKSIDVEVFVNDNESTIEFPFNLDEWESFKIKIINRLSEIDNFLLEEVKEKEALIYFCKWGKLLPPVLQVEILKERAFDFDGAKKIIIYGNLVKLT